MNKKLNQLFPDRQPRTHQDFGHFGFHLVFAMTLLVFAFFGNGFLQISNLVNIIEGSSILLILALAMTLVVALGGIDLSIGIAFDFGAAFAIIAMKWYDVNWVYAVLWGMAGGMLVGALNAVLVTRLSVNAFMATLGTFFIGGSLQRVVTNGGGPISHRQAPSQYHDLSVGETLFVPNEILIAGAIFAIYFVVMECSIFGPRVRAIGKQKRAAFVAGIRVDRYVAVGLILAACTCAIAGILGSANLRMFTPLAGSSYLLDAIAAVFIGASMHHRGRPNVVGTLFGVLFLGVVDNGLNLMGLDFNTKDAVSGIIILLALAFSVAQQKYRASFVVNVTKG